jgi:uncharacterized protein
MLAVVDLVELVAFVDPPAPPHPTSTAMAAAGASAAATQRRALMIPPLVADAGSFEGLVPGEERVDLADSAIAKIRADEADRLPRSAPTSPGASMAEANSTAHGSTCRSPAYPARDTGAVSRENVELVREGIAAFMRGDAASVKALVDPDVVTYRAPPLPDAQTFHGPDGVVQAYVTWTAQFGEFDMTTGELIDAGDQVIVELIQRGTGQASGVEVEGHFWCVYTLAAGKVRRLDIFNDRNTALETAGLRERP